MYQKDLETGLVQLILKAETEIPSDITAALKRAFRIEKGAAKVQLKEILTNINLAKQKQYPVCQDCQSNSPRRFGRLLIFRLFCQ